MNRSTLTPDDIASLRTATTAALSVHRSSSNDDAYLQFRTDAPQIELAVAAADGARSCLLSPVELETVRLAAHGMSNKTIGRQRWVSENTVKTMMASAMRKLGAANRAHAVAQAIRAGLI